MVQIRGGEDGPSIAIVTAPHFRCCAVPRLWARDTMMMIGDRKCLCKCVSVLDPEDG